MDHNTLTFSFFLIFTGAAVLASLALYTRQPLILAYIVLGALIGPFGLGWVEDIELLEDSGHIGIMFLLFLLGLDMQPKALHAVAKQATLVAIASSILFFGIGYAVSYIFGFTLLESIIIGLSCMFSSTIISIKLLPTTILHHKHAGDLIVGLLLLQDLIAIFTLIILFSSGSEGNMDYRSLGITLVSLPLIAFAAYLFVRFLLLKLISQFDRVQEYIFLIALGWCLGMAELSAYLGLSAEIGAFIAGVTLATSPISQYIALNLKPLRDFFLVLFFFALGARFNLGLIQEIILPAVSLTILVVALKPVVFRLLLSKTHERKELAWSVGLRLGQNSEFALLIAYMASSVHLIGQEASHLIQAIAILSFVISTYIVILVLPTPISLNDKLRRD